MPTLPALKPTPTDAVLAQQFLDIRCRILDLASQLDRLDRGGKAQSLATDPKGALIQKGLELLTSDFPRLKSTRKAFGRVISTN